MWYLIARVLKSGKNILDLYIAFKCFTNYNFDIISYMSSK